MNLLDFGALSLWTNLAIFVVASVFVWIAGTRLAAYADAIGESSGLSQAFLGMVLLGVATSLPEVATTTTASLIGNARLVSGNLFGGVLLQIAVLAIVDLVAVRGALTYFIPHPVLLFQGVMLLLLLALSLAGAASGEPLSLFGMGLTPFLLVAGYLFTVRLSSGGDYLPRWKATGELPKPSEIEEQVEEDDDDLEGTSKRKIYFFAALAGAAIFAAGWTLAQAGDALSEQTGLGASFIGIFFVAGSTSLPELSTALGAVRRGNHEMAVSNILGTNCLELALFFLADLCYRQGPIMAETERSAIFAGTLGMIVTCIFLIGLLERRDKTVFGMGVDSFLVLVVYLAGLGGLYYLR